jgi:hypothetical protein
MKALSRLPQVGSVIATSGWGNTPKGELTVTKVTLVKGGEVLRVEGVNLQGKIIVGHYLTKMKRSK